MTMDDAAFDLFVRSCREAELYFVINECGGFVWRMTHDMNNLRIPIEHHAAVRKDAEAMQKRLELAVEQTMRFGVAQPRVTRTSILTGEEFRGASDEYWAWFRWWDAWSKSLSDDEFKKMDAAMSSKADLSNWRPAGDWRDSLNKEAVTN